MSESNDIVKPKKRYYVLKHTIPTGRPPVDPEERFWQKIKIMPKLPGQDTGCWLWTAGKDVHGYGVFSHGQSRWIKAHRWSYMAHIGEIHEGLLLLHSCDNPSCVCPYHLRPGTHQDNMSDKVLKGRTHDQSGEKNHQAKLTSNVVISIFNAIGSNKEIGLKYGVSHKEVSRIKTGKRWSQITNPMI